jgi:TonB-linked SusC/RagA family outer membrane protein
MIVQSINYHNEKLMVKTLQHKTGLLRAAKIPLMIAFLALMGFKGLSQEITVSGTVTDKGTPLPGVSIIEKGTARGTTTDSDGKFTVIVSSPSAVLIFSFIGYKTNEQAVNSRTVIELEMEEDVTALSEVVVTALGVQKDVKSLGFAVQKVEGSAIQKAREPNVFNSLTGKVAGLEIRNQTDLFQDPGIRLRGAKPLIVVDGVPMVDADLWKINADDIETFNVLKGANASALYGSIGRNGAIMITTKRGSLTKTTVEVNSSTMLQTGFIRIPEVQTTYGNGYNGQYAYVDGSGGGTEGGGWIWGPKLNQPDPNTPSGFWETTQFNSPIDPNTGERIPTPFLAQGANNVEDFFRTGIISTNNVSISSGNESGNFRVSVSNNYQRGIVPNSQLNNTSFGVSGGYKLAKNLKADASITYNRQYTDNFPETGYGPNNYLYNLVLWTGPDINVNDLRDYWEKGNEGIQQRNYNKSWYNNPYFQAYEYKRGYYKDNVFGQLKLNYTIAPGFDLMLRSGINQHGLNRTWKEPKSYVAYDYLSRGNFSLLTETNFNINTDFLAQYNKKFGANVNIRVSAGGANRWNTFRQQTQTTDGLVIPGFYNLSNSANPLRGTNAFQEEKVNSVYGTLDLELYNGIFLGVTGRNDWVSTMPLQNNSFFYPSASLSGVISDFIDLNNYKISFLKVRGSWSKVTDGRITVNGSSPYQHIPGYSPGINWNNTPSLQLPGTLIDPNISPQSSETYEAGLDVRLFSGRLGVDAAFYRIRDFNNIYNLPISNSSGYTNRLVNGGEFLRKGFEITVTANPLKTTALTWNITANYSQYHRYLEASFDGSNRLGSIKVGERMDQDFWYKYQTSPGGQLILGLNGFPVDDPYLRHMGNTDPNFIFGIQNNLTYKNFILGISFDGRVGGVMYSTTNQKMWWGGTHPNTVNQYRDDANNGIASYIAPGLVVVEGSATYDSDGNIIEDTRIYAPNSTPVNYIAWNVNTSNYAYTNYSYYNQSFVKLREITITYQVPSSILSKTFFTKANIGVVGRNLAVWTKVPNVDPDTGSDNLQTPSTRNIGINLNFTF